MTDSISASIFAWTQQSGAASADGAGESATAEGVATQGQAPQGPMPGCGGAGGQGMGKSTMIMFGVMIVAMYFLMIRPQQKKAKEHQAMLDSIKKGSEVVTNGGLIGRVTGIADKTVTVEVSEKVRVRILRSQVAGLYSNVDKTEKK